MVGSNEGAAGGSGGHAAGSENNMVAEGHLIRGTQQTASGGRLHHHQPIEAGNNKGTLVDSQNIHASGNVINNNFNIINNFMGSLPPEASGPNTATSSSAANNRANSAATPNSRTVGTIALNNSGTTAGSGSNQLS